MKEGFIIAIDGPVASGKGTIAHLLAEKLNGFDLYTGGTYRALALACLQKGIDLTSGSDVENALSQIKIDVKKQGKIFLDGQDVTERIQHSDVAMASSDVATNPRVRKELVKQQRTIGEKARENGDVVVVEGRDTGTVVFPDADLKVFLTASPTIRARRRTDQLTLAGNKDITFEKVFSDVKERDKQDLERDADPLVSSPQEHGYEVVDNSDLTQQETLDVILEKAKEKGLQND